MHLVLTSKQQYHCNRPCQMRPHFCDTRAVVLVQQRQNLCCKIFPRPHWYLVRSSLKKKETILEIIVLGCLGEVSHMYPSRLRPNPYLISGVTRAHVGHFFLKISITDLYSYCIFVEYLRYKVLIFCLCR